MAALACGLALAGLGCAWLYLASPHQTWREQAWPARSACAGGGVLLLAGFALFFVDLRPLTAVFAFFTFLMLSLLACPAIGALFELGHHR